MIKIEFHEPDTQTWKRWRSACKKATETLIESIKAGVPPDVTNLYKRKSIKVEVYFSKSGPFRAKCAYCECYLDDLQRGDVDHFRPKFEVTDENDNRVDLTDRNGNKIRDQAGQPIPHPGYYWLAYEWTNLLPSCTFCNQPNSIMVEVEGRVIERKTGKHSRFPVENQHATKPEEVISERPLLINPVVEDPSAHWEVDIETGFLRARTSRGEMCIRVFALNDRERLPEKRKSAMIEVAAKLDEILKNTNPANRQRALDELRKILEGEREHTIAALAKIRSHAPYLWDILNWPCVR